MTANVEQTQQPKADVGSQRVAQTYLRKTNRTVGWFQPVNSAR